MSKTKKANEGVVTAIGDVDLVMVSGANGSWRPISFANLMAAIRSGIQVGGRNLLSYRCNANQTASWSNGVVTLIKDGDTYFNIPLANPSLLKVGETYTISFDCEGMKAGNTWIMMGVQNSGQFSIPMKNGRCQATFVLNDKQFPAGTLVFGFDDGTRNFPYGFSQVRLSRFKLERGNVATDWTPAPEDIASGLWGGVNQRFTINYKLDSKEGRKGGEHEPNNQGKCLSNTNFPSRGIELYGKSQWLVEICGSISNVVYALYAESTYLPAVRILLHQSSVDNICNDSSDLGCTLFGDKGRCLNSFGNGIGYRSDRNVFLSIGFLCRRKSAIEFMEWTMLSDVDGGRSSIVGEYLITVKPRKEVAA